MSGAQLWRYRAESTELLARAWPRGGPGRKHVEQVHRWLALTASLGFVPIPVPDRAGQTVHEWQGLQWEIAPMDARIGRSGHARPPPSMYGWLSRRLRRSTSGWRASRSMVSPPDFDKGNMKSWAS